MIIASTTIAKDGVTYNQLTYLTDFWAVGYDDDNIIRLITTDENPLGANEVINSKLNGFGSTSYTELLDEINNLGLIWED